MAETEAELPPQSEADTSSKNNGDQGKRTTTVLYNHLCSFVWVRILIKHPQFRKGMINVCVAELS